MQRIFWDEFPMKPNIILKIFLLSFFAYLHAVAQSSYQNDFKFDHILPGENIRENSVTCFLQDSQGFIWIGTKGGLFRYDGYNFKSFKMEPQNENSLSDNFVRCILEYSDDQFILIGTDRGGLNIFDKKTGKFFRFLHHEKDSSSISNNSVWDIVEDKSGRIWIATGGGGLNLFDVKERTFKKFSPGKNGSQPQCKNFVRCLYLDSEKKLWVGTRFCGLFYFDIDSRVFHRISDKNNFRDLKACDIWSITQDGNRNLWIGTYNRGIYVINLNEKGREKLIRLSERNGLGNYHIVKISKDSENTIWVSAWGGGLLWYDANRNRFEGYQNDENDPESISSNLVLSFFEDNASTFWIGTHAGGINVYQPQKWKFTPYKFMKIRKNTVHFNSARSVYFDDRERILYVGSTFGLYRFVLSKNDQIDERLKDKDFGISDNLNINAICRGRNAQNLWLGTNNGLFRWNTVTNKFRQFRIQLTEPYRPGAGIIVEVAMDETGFLWLITATGKLYRFSLEKEIFQEIRLQKTVAFSIFIDQNSLIYLGTLRGVMVGDAVTLKFRPLFSDSSKFKIIQKSITTLFRDSQGNLWIGTWEYGLYRYDEQTGRLNIFSERDGLASNHICAILEDKNGFLYISTDKGISRFDPYKEEFVNFDIGDGLHGNNFENNSCSQSQTGLMFFGGINGYSFFNPRKLKQNRFIPPVHIPGFEILHAKSDFKQNIMFTSSVQLNYKMNSFIIEFVALNFINALKNRYLYKLEGYDREWQGATTHRRVTYKNVPPGKYTFRVIGSNNDGFWNEKGDSLSIYIKPPFWQTLYFKIMVIFLLTVIIYYNINRRFALLRKESEARRLFTRALIEKQENERKRIAAELHDSLGQDLLLIKNQTNLLLKNEAKRNPERLQQIESVASEAISNIRQIAFALHPYQLDSLGLTDCIRQMIKKMGASTEIRISYRIEKINGLLPKEHEINLYRIAQEILNNILKHSKAKNARIEIRRSERFIKMTFTDDGVGFDYARIKETAKGFGFADIKERVEILNGRLKIKSNSATGTEIVIRIPVRR